MTNAETESGEQEEALPSSQDSHTGLNHASGVSSVIDAIRPAEQLALELALELSKSRFPRQLLATTLGRGQAAWKLSEQYPEVSADLWFLDDYQCQLAQQSYSAPAKNVRWLCQSDVPQTVYDMALVPCSIQGEAELTRDQMQSAFMQLEMGGVLIAAVDNPRDVWLREQFDAFGEITQVLRNESGIAYACVKRSELKKRKSFDCRFAFRDQGRLIHVLSRPSVFSHRRLDAGARQLLNATAVKPGMRVLDIGCGAGVVGIALALRAEGISLHAVDSNPRAVQCVLQAAEWNGVTRISTQVASDGVYGEPASFDLAVANPPYYAGNRIAACFVNAADRALKQGGELVLVTKKPGWYQSEIPGTWSRIEIEPMKDYWIVRGRKA